MKKLLPLFLTLVCASAVAQTFEVKDTVVTTYPFSDPNPLPAKYDIYPYFTYETFAFNPVQQSYKMVVLENDYIRVKIFPEIGGKIWSAFDKTQKKEMFYDNKVIKFREIALRGPWTSGGIEFNYGVIGHAPSCAAPVDYEVVKKEDGSVSCYIGVQELLSETRWMVEINLPSNAAWLRTTSFWHNYSGTYQPYYSWANSGVTASDDMELIYPATYSITHDGKIEKYPVDENGRDISKYSNQAYGPDKSLHPGGSHKGYFGVYWANDDFGMMHYALRDEKLGRKYFSWTQSQEGGIWVDVLTDDNPQYVELQSGRLFNQNVLGSFRTPYKQTLFTPYSTDEWSEYWLPFSQIGSVDNINLYAAVNLENSEAGLELGIYPVQALKGALALKNSKGEVLAVKDIDIEPTKAISLTFNLPNLADLASIYVGNKKLWSVDSEETSRPNTINKEYSFTTAESYLQHAIYYLGMREYYAAETHADYALEADPALIGALNVKAVLALRTHRNEEALGYSTKALAIDTYNPEANYFGGIAAKRLGKLYDAMDRFEVAAITTDLRSASYLQLAKIHFIEGDTELAAAYANKSLVGNAHNVSALELLYQIKPSEQILERIESCDPLHHFPDAERLLAGKISAEEFDASIKEEMKWQNYLDLACLYNEIGLKDKAIAILNMSLTKNILIGLWTAYLNDDIEGIAAAEALNIDFIFPFRGESLAPLEWAVKNGGGWKSKYQLSMLKDFLNYHDEALALISGNEADYAPYYAYRYSKTRQREDMEKAFELDPNQWRYRQYLALSYYYDGDYEKTIDLVGKYYESNRDNYHIGDTYVKALIASSKYEKAEKVQASMKILPFEGLGASHVMYRDIKLHLALKALDKGDYKIALKKAEQSREWPEHLGVGKPYDDMIDNKMEDCICAIVYKRQGNDTKAEEYLSRFATKDENLVELYNKAIVKEKKGYSPVSQLISNMDSTLDKKLF